MKAFYCEHGIYPATYSFKDEVDGTSGNDIDGFSLFSTTDTNGACVIIASEDGHKKVMKISGDGDNGTNILIYDVFDSPQTSGTIEFWIKYIDNGQGLTRFYLYHQDWIQVIYFYIDHATNLLNAVYGDGVGGNTWVNTAVTTNVWNHVKITFDCATDKQSIWVKGDVLIDDENFQTDRVATTINRYRIYLDGGGGANALESYFDAFGYSWDTDYNIGDNLDVDFHYYNKEQITSIIQYPIIAPRLNAYWMGILIIRDFEGALFASWHGRDFNKILIEDNSSNILFRGFLTKKLFKKDSLVLSIAGIGVLLDWEPFGSDGYINYIKAEGLIKVPILATSVLNVKDNLGANFTWDPDWWIEGAKDLGVLIVDKTTINTRTWDSSAIRQSGGTVIDGNNASTITFNDSNYYQVRDTTTPNLGLQIHLTIDGIAVDDTDYLKNIQIEYNFRLKVWVGPTTMNVTVYLEILKDYHDWRIIDQISLNKANTLYVSEWCTGVPLDVDGGNGNEEVIRDTDTELQKFFNKTGATYSSLKGLRFRVKGNNNASYYAEVQVDYIKVKPGYTTQDTAPVMEAITDSTATSLACADVSAWDEKGIIENDGFKIGQNTRNVIQDIASQSGLTFHIVDNLGNTSSSGVHYPNADTATIEWQTTGGDHFGELDDDNDATYVSTAGHDLDDIYAFGDVNLRGGYISSISIKSRVKVSALEKQSLTNRYSVDGGSSWSSYKSVDTTVNWVWKTVSWSGLEIYDLSDFQVELNNFRSAAGTVYCSELYVVFTINGSSFDKYIARKFKGMFCIEPLKATCKLEGAHWYEDYINNRIVVIKLADFVDSTIDITSGGEIKWEYEDDCNQVKSFYVFGKAEDEIFAKAVDESISGYISKQIIDETITNVADAQEIADAQLALLKTKRPSIKVPLPIGTYPLIQLGTTVDLTMVRPTVVEATYPIRMIERSNVGVSIKTVIYCGLGETEAMESIMKTIRKNRFRSHKALTDRLI